VFGKKRQVVNSNSEETELVQVRIGNSVVLPCVFETEVDANRVLWLQGSRVIAFADSLKDHSSYSLQNSTSKTDYSLRVENSTISQSGIFSCQNPITQIIQKVKVDVISEPNPPILKARNVYQEPSLPKNTVSVVKDQSNLLECRVEKARPKANIFWVKNGNKIMNRALTLENGEHQIANSDPDSENTNSGLFWSSSVLTLLADDIVSSDEYACVIEHPTLEKSWNKIIDLNVMVKPEASLVALPRIVEENSNIEFTCSSKNAIPAPHKYTLVIDDVIFDTNQNGVFSFNNAKRELNNKQISCVSENRAGRSTPAEIEMSKDLIIAYGPEMSHTSSSLITVNTESELTIACPVKSAPEPRITWLKQAENGEFVRIINQNAKTTENLIFQVKAAASNAGIYKCEAENTFLGKKSESGVTEVKVTGKPWFFDAFNTRFEYEISNPVMMQPFASTPGFDNVKVSWKNLTNSPVTLTAEESVVNFRGGKVELIQLDVQNYKKELLSLGFDSEKIPGLSENNDFLRFSETIGVVKFTFSKYAAIPSKIQVSATNELGTDSMYFRPVASDTVGRIAAIIGGCIAGAILILAAIVAGVYYQRRQTKNRTYQPGSIVNRGCSDSTTPIMGNGQNGSNIVNSGNLAKPAVYASSLSSSQRDDGYITEQSHHTSYNEKVESNTENSGLINNISMNQDSASDSIDVSKAQTESSSMLKVLPCGVLPKIVGSVNSSGAHTGNDSKSIESSNPETADLPLPPPELAGSTVVDGYNPEHFRSVYTSHFSGSGRANSGSSSGGGVQNVKKASISGSSRASHEFPTASLLSSQNVPYQTMSTRRKTKSGSQIQAKQRSLTQV